jgi:hypothetical protein
LLIIEGYVADEVPDLFERVDGPFEVEGQRVPYRAPYRHDDELDHSEAAAGAEGGVDEDGCEILKPADNHAQQGPEELPHQV